MRLLVPIGWLPLLLALAAIGYTLFAVMAVRRFAHAPQPPAAPPEPVTLLKPLHGAEPLLAENLAGFLDQGSVARVQMVAGANRKDDAALPVARTLGERVTVIAGAPPLGANAKIANLANMLPVAEHDLLILSDSDMAVPRDYIARVAAALARPGLGAVTCAYRGRGDAGAWSRWAAAGIDWQFLPGVLVSAALGVGDPCMGSTFALRRSTLEAIGGFAAFRDALADDHAMGEGVRGLGLEVALVPGLVLVHACAEASFGALWRHEVRWQATVRAISRPAHAAGLLTHPLPLALIAAAFHAMAGGVAVALALASRVILARAVRRFGDSAPLPLAFVPLRDLLSFAVFLASFSCAELIGAALRLEWSDTAAYRLRSIPDPCCAPCSSRPPRSTAMTAAPARAIR